MKMKYRENMSKDIKALIERILNADDAPLSFSGLMLKLIIADPDLVDSFKCWNDESWMNKILDYLTDNFTRQFSEMSYGGLGISVERVGENSMKVLENFVRSYDIAKDMTPKMLFFQMSKFNDAAHKWYTGRDDPDEHNAEICARLSNLNSELFKRLLITSPEKNEGKAL